jgi:hypothetical protein
MKHRTLTATLALSLIVGCASAPPALPTPTESPGDTGNATTLRAAGIDPAALHCNTENRWGKTIRADAQAGAEDVMALLGPHTAGLAPEAREALSKEVRDVVMWRMIRAVLVEGDNNNLGVVPLKGRTWRDAAGKEHPVLLFRSGVTPNPDTAGSCFQSLLGAGGVRHVVNLFDGAMPVADLVAAEGKAAAAHGATYRTATDEGYGPWRDILRKHMDDPEKRAVAMDGLSRLIREQILNPDGAAPKGNVHVHCGGGMHRTGMVVGVIERCINGAPPQVVEAGYKRHVGYRDAEHPGGFEEGNLRVIREFDCGLLTPVAKP